MGNTWQVNSNADMNDWEKLVIRRDGRQVFSAHGHQSSEFGNFIETLSGWWGSPGAARQYGLERPFGGFTQSPTVTQPRTITITGWSYCESDVHAIRTARSLPGDIFLMDGKVHTYELETYGFETTLWAQVELDGAVICEPTTYEREVSWQIPLRTITPYVYGPLQEVYIVPEGTRIGLQFPLFEPGYLDWGSNTYARPYLTNDGNQPAWPKVTLTGNSPAGCYIEDGRGHSVIYRGPITSSGVVLDFESGMATTTGTISTMEYVTKRDWWSVAPGSRVTPRVRAIQEDTAIYAKIELRPAYL